LPSSVPSPCDAVAGELHAQAEGDLVAGALAGFVLGLDEVVLAAASELADEGRLQRLADEALGVQLHGQGVVDAVTRGCHWEL
jgi:hypothetical protein